MNARHVFQQTHLSAFRRHHHFANASPFFRRTLLPICQSPPADRKILAHTASTTTMPPKRKASSPVRPSPSKKQQMSNGDFDHSRIAERVGIVQREFYPAEMSNERCKMYNDGELPRPIEVLNDAIKHTEAERRKIQTGECVVHWFKRDLRLNDNRALSLASKKAQEARVPLIAIFLVSPQDFQAHSTSAARVDFIIRTLEVLKEDLAEKDIPLYTATVDNRKDVPKHILQKCEEWGAKHVFCNIEYEVDELRREAKATKMALKQGVDFAAIHNDCVVAPGELKSGSGNQYSVYSPWYRAWVKHIHEHPHLLDLSDPPASNPSSARQKFKSVFDLPIPSAPATKTLDPDHQKRLASIWPAGEHEAQARLERFLSEKITKYKETRNLPGENSTSLLSVHLAAGTLSSRNAVRSARDANKASKKLDGGNAGIVSWISEVAWRDFYKHVIAHWPYVCMAKPFKYEYSDIAWEYDDQAFAKWKDGKTGFPIVDAAMRQVKGMAYMHNRCRMIVASFLAKDLLLDWRQGEKFFMENLIDGDFASNNGGWGFSASTGVDPQPYFRIFNPLLQSEKFDDTGEYIRKWVPELKGVQGKAIHDPYGRGAAKEAEKNGYPRPIVDHKVCRERALERYKGGLGRSTANVGGGVHN